MIIGSSLQIYSSFKFVLFALEKKKKSILMINIGPSRADHFNEITFIRKRAGELLPCVDLSKLI